MRLKPVIPVLSSSCPGSTVDVQRFYFRIPSLQHSVQVPLAQHLGKPYRSASHVYCTWHAGGMLKLQQDWRPWGNMKPKGEGDQALSDKNDRCVTLTSGHRNTLDTCSLPILFFPMVHVTSGSHKFARDVRVGVFTLTAINLTCNGQFNLDICQFYLE